MKKRLFTLMIVALLIAACGSSGKATDTPEPIQVAEVTDTPRPEPTETPAPTLSPTATATPLPPTDTPSPTDTPVPPTAAIQSSVAHIVTSLDDFFEESYKQLLLRNPEKLTELGIAESYRRSHRPRLSVGMEVIVLLCQTHRPRQVAV